MFQILCIVTGGTDGSRHLFLQINGEILTVTSRAAAKAQLPSTYTTTLGMTYAFEVVGDDE